MHLPGHAKADPKDRVGAHIGTSGYRGISTVNYP
jgi:hypothetical protein